MRSSARYCTVAELVQSELRSGDSASRTAATTDCTPMTSAQSTDPGSGRLRVRSDGKSVRHIAEVWTEAARCRTERGEVSC